MAMSSVHLAHGELEFALPQAVNLAEAGATTSDKRIGMCSISNELELGDDHRQRLFVLC